MRWLRCGLKWVFRHLFRIYFISLLAILVLVATVAYLYANLPVSTKLQTAIIYSSSPEPIFHLRRIKDAPVREIHPVKKIKTAELPKKCHMYNCFDIHRCGKAGDGRLSIYIYPIEKFVFNGRIVQSEISKEFYTILDAVRRSPFYTRDPAKACIFLPSIDLLQVGERDFESVEAVLRSLEHWGDTGRNHVLITTHGKVPFLTRLKSEAILVAPAFPKDLYSLGFHVPIISSNPLLVSSNGTDLSIQTHVDFLAISANGGVLANYFDGDSSILFVDFCRSKKFGYSIRCSGQNRRFHYPDILQRTNFCIVDVHSAKYPVLWDILSVNCIPVIISNGQRLPFDEFIDWRKLSISIYEHQLPHLSSILRAVSPHRIKMLKTQIAAIFNSHFKTMSQITLTLLNVLSERVFSQFAKSTDLWNRSPYFPLKRSPLFNPEIAAKGPGFTAVILAYERITSLVQVVQTLSGVSSLAKIIIVWNNQVKKPPKLSVFPKIPKPIQIIQTGRNVLSNRFLPYDEIETEAVFSLDDDIIMLTADEIEFAFETWREFPDRLVGFPSRTHIWMNGTTRKWKYESEWRNDISMVLTGAGFYHKYWHYSYTTELPAEIRSWVDSKMNCEDIAMNFLVAHKTGKPPIKVTPRKKFKCPTCSNNEMLSTDSGHMVERTDCMNKFTQIFGYMPLIAVEFRADPVLYKVDPLPNKMKRFPNIGSL